MRDSTPLRIRGMIKITNMPLTISIIVIYNIPLIFKGVEYLILYLPPTSTTTDNLSHILLTDTDVRDPTVMVSYLPLIHQPVFNIVYQYSIFVPIEWNVVDPLNDMHTFLYILYLYPGYLSELSLLVNPFRQYLMILRLGYQDVAHPLGL